MKQVRFFAPAIVLLSATAAMAPACSDSTNTPASKPADKDAGGKTDAGGSSDDAGEKPCGDGVISAGEACDTKIAAGTAGACPTAADCDDHDPCTVNGVAGAGTCTATCDYGTKVTASLAAKDQCCPAGADATTDADCDPNCGNGKLDTGETCDPKITSGTGACDTSCPDDGNPCTNETLVTADPCRPQCKSNAITAPKDGDQCCPVGANAANDSDCSATCGNGTVESGEDCDDTTASCKNCKFVPTAFRFTSLEVVEPVLTLSTDCSDVAVAVNGLISNGFVGDKAVSDSGAGDGRLDLSFVLLARPLDQTTASGTGEFLSDADCAAPSPPATCGPDPSITPQAAKVVNHSSGVCLTPDPTRFNPSDSGSLHVPNTPTAGTDGCYVSDGRQLDLSISGIAFTFQTARIAAEWVGTPATGMTQGVIEAFMTTAQAQAILLTPLGGQPLSVLLRGSPDSECTTFDDSRVGPDGVTKGYWFYFNFTAEKVPWTGN